MEQFAPFSEILDNFQFLDFWAVLAIFNVNTGYNDPIMQSMRPNSTGGPKHNDHNTVFLLHLFYWFFYRTSSTGAPNPSEAPAPKAKSPHKQSRPPAPSYHDDHDL